jgi:hypothetical protein
VFQICDELLSAGRHAGGAWSGLAVVVQGGAGVQQRLAGTIVMINDTAPTRDRWNLALIEILAVGG